MLIIVIVCINEFIINNKSKYEMNEELFSGQIIEKQINGNKLTIKIKGQEKLIGNYYIKTKEEKDYLLNNLKCGSKIYIKGQLEKPFNNTIPNTFNYKKHLNNQNIFYMVNIEKYEIDNQSISLIYRIKNYIEKRINSIGGSSEYLQMFILGNKNELEYDVYDDYQKLGVSHLFAISGMHLTIFSSLLLFFLRKKIGNEKISFIIVFFFLFCYTFILSFSASVVRALVSFFVFGTRRLFKLNIKSVDMMLVVLIIVMIINYKYIYNIGFQYSYLCSLGIIMFNPLIKRVNNYFVKVFVISLIALVFSLPISAMNFYEINIFSVFSNLIFVPLISLVIYPLSLITFLLPFLDNILLLLINFMELISNIILKIFVLNIIIPKTYFIMFVIYYLIIILFYKNIKIITTLLLVWLLIIKLNPYIDKNTYVYFLDVGQGDSAVIKSAYNKELIMIDTGGRINFKQEDWQVRKTKSNLSNNIVTFLKSIGKNSIDLLILTHGDVDHLGYAVDIIEQFKVKNIMLNQGAINDLEEKIINTNLVVDDYKSKYIKYFILSTRDYGNENDNSIVLMFYLSGYKFLFMGDAGKVVERNILDKYNLKEIDFLKVGHHGSNTSSGKEFIDSINPKYSLISVGRNNRYGHPNDSVLDNLKKRGVFRTDKDGSIRIKINKDGYKIRACTP